MFAFNFLNIWNTVIITVLMSLFFFSVFKERAEVINARSFFANISVYCYKFPLK